MIETVGDVALDDPCRASTIGGADLPQSRDGTPFRSKAMRTAAKDGFIHSFQYHRHTGLHNAVTAGWNAQSKLPHHPNHLRDR